MAYCRRICTYISASFYSTCF